MYRSVQSVCCAAAHKLNEASTSTAGCPVKNRDQHVSDYTNTTLCVCMFVISLSYSLLHNPLLHNSYMIS